MSPKVMKKLVYVQYEKNTDSRMERLGLSSVSNCNCWNNAKQLGLIVLYSARDT